MVNRSASFVTTQSLFAVHLQVVLCVLLAVSGWPSNALADARPNIIIILADDLGAGDLSLNGSPIRTPHIDELARNGVQLTNFYASANVCTPSRAGLLTGRYPIRSGLAKGVIEVESSHGLPQSEITIASYLKGAGYRTAMVGKWHLGHSDGHLPNQHGFEHFFGVHYSNDMRPLALYENADVIQGEAHQPTLTRQYTEAARMLIADDDERPFFLYLAHTFPHIPLHASDSFRGRSSAGIYGDAVEELDWSVGELVAALDEGQQLENTLILFTSDNGAWFEGSNANLRDMKGLTWDGGYRVPLIASWPDRIPAGTVAHGIAMNIDLLPTITALLDRPIDATLDGKDIWPLLQGSDSSPHEALYLFNDEDIAAVRTQRWKYVVLAYYKTRYIGFEGVRDAMGFDYELLFDMTARNPERYSMATNEPEVLRSMQHWLQRGREEFEPLRTGPPARVFP